MVIPKLPFATCSLVHFTRCCCCKGFVAPSDRPTVRPNRWSAISGSAVCSRWSAGSQECLSCNAMHSAAASFCCCFSSSPLLPFFCFLLFFYPCVMQRVEFLLFATGIAVSSIAYAFASVALILSDLLLLLLYMVLLCHVFVGNIIR